VQRTLLKVALAALVLADIMFLPFAGILVIVGGIQGLLGVNGHGTGSQGGFLLGAAVLAGAGVLIAAVLVWLTWRTLLALRSGASAGALSDDESAPSSP
jgi:hypothetical protein